MDSDRRSRSQYSLRNQFSPHQSSIRRRPNQPHRSLHHLFPTSSQILSQRRQTLNQTIKNNNLQHQSTRFTDATHSENEQNQANDEDCQKITNSLVHSYLQQRKNLTVRNMNILTKSRNFKRAQLPATNDVGAAFYTASIREDVAGETMQDL